MRNFSTKVNFWKFVHLKNAFQLSITWEEEGKSKVFMSKVASLNSLLLGWKGIWEPNFPVCSIRKKLWNWFLFGTHKKGRWFAYLSKLSFLPIFLLKGKVLVYHQKMCWKFFLMDQHGIQLNSIHLFLRGDLFMIFWASPFLRTFYNRRIHLHLFSDLKPIFLFGFEKWVRCILIQCGTVFIIFRSKIRFGLKISGDEYMYCLSPCNPNSPVPLIYGWLCKW